MKDIWRNFDARQQQEIGKSFILGFAIVAFLLIALPIVDIFYGKPVFAEKMAENLFILCFSLMVVLCYQVVKDAYFPAKIKQNKLKTGLFLVGAGLVMLIFTGNGPFFKNGQINNSSFSMFFYLGPGLLIIGKSLVAKFF